MVFILEGLNAGLIELLMANIHSRCLLYEDDGEIAMQIIIWRSFSFRFQSWIRSS